MKPKALMYSPHSGYSTAYTPLVGLRRLLPYVLLILATVMLATMPEFAFAQTGLPTVGDPASSGTGSGIIDKLRGYAGMAAILVGLLLATSAFLVVGGGAMGKFNEARKKGEWGEFAVVLVVGVLLVVAVLWLANEAATIL